MSRDPNLGTEKFIVVRWDYFTDESTRIDGAETMEDALRIVNKHYGGQLWSAGINRVEIINNINDIVWSSGIK